LANDKLKGGVSEFEFLGNFIKIVPLITCEDFVNKAVRFVNTSTQRQGVIV